MANEWSRLVKVLEEEAELHGALIVSAVEKRDMIVRNELDGLEAIGITEERLAGRLRAADRERERISLALAARLGLDADPVRLGSLSERAPEPARSRLRNIGARLRSLVAELAGTNREIGDLLDQALLHILAFFKLIADTLTQKPTYSAGTARMTAAPAASMLDRKA